MDTSKRLNTRKVILVSSSLIVIGTLLNIPLLPIKRETKIRLGYPKDSLLNFTELTAEYGYLSEEHKVVTEDGYILTMFRITKGRNCKGKISSPPVILVHGLLQSSDSFIHSGPNAGLAYLIADACYDLWVPNTRGNYYSRQHIRLKPDKDAEYWDFDIDKMGLYDVPAIIDYVQNYTDSSKVNYIGYSQGCGIFFVMCSERPGYCENVQMMISLAPAAKVINTHSKIFRIFLQSFDKLETILSTFGVHEILPKGSFFQEFLAFFCHITEFTRKMCENSIDYIDHVDSYHGSFSNTTTKVLFGQFPAGTSLRNMARYGQSMRTKNFGKYSYGKSQNLVVYGSEEPPKYNLSAVTVPVVCIYGKNDGMVHSKDVKWLATKLPNVLELVEVHQPLWNHLDVTYSQYTGEMIFPKISEYLLKYSKR